MKTVFFKEEQRITNAWLWLLVSGLSAIYLYALVEQIFLNQPFGDNSTNDIALITFGIMPFILMILLLKVKLTIILDEEGCKFQFSPFHLKQRVIKWDEIKKIYLRKYNPVFEYGGWGIRVLPFSKNIAYNIKGNYGIQIELKNNKKILLGTSETKEVEKALTKINLN